MNKKNDIPVLLFSLNCSQKVKSFFLGINVFEIIGPLPHNYIVDNYTLLIIVAIIVTINAAFTIPLAGSVDRVTSRSWRISSLCLMAGFILLIFQGKLPLFFSIILSNSIIFTGFFFQVETAVAFKYKERRWNGRFFLLLILLLNGFFLYFTYVRFNTSIRIMVLSALMFLLYGYGARLLRKDRNNEKEQPGGLRGIFYIFLFSAIFYLFRLFSTSAGLGRVGSLFDANLVTSLSFLQVIILCVTFTMGLLNYALKDKNETIQTERNQLKYLFRFLSDTAQHLDISQLYESIEKTLRNTLGVNNAAIFLIDEETEEIRLTYDYNDLGLPLDQVRVFRKGEGATGNAVSQDRVIEIDMKTYPIKTIADAYSSKGISKLFSAPIKSFDGILGAITIAVTMTEEKGLFDRDFFYHLGELVGLVMRNASLFNSTIRLAHTDALTGLMNRRKMTDLLHDEIKRMERCDRTFSLAIADMDDFKKVNDTYGHGCGDEVLLKASRVFRETCRETDFISRWGGEEFLFLFVETSLEEAKQVAERIRLNMGETPIECLSGARKTISIGLTEYNRELNLDQMMKKADEALYSAKNKGKNRIDWKS